MISYNHGNIEFRNIFTDSELKHLEEISQEIPFNEFAKSMDKFSSLITKSIYASARIEYNTYTETEVSMLLDANVTAEDKPLSDALMIMGIKDAYDYVMETKIGEPIGYRQVMEIHGALTRRILEKECVGTTRKDSVTIGNSDYVPPSGPVILDSELRNIIVNSIKFGDPFERAVYLHCNIAYLQPFYDGNKRTARLTQVMSMMSMG
jgi:Fic family protein